MGTLVDEKPFSKYYIWTIGCQMNTADSERLAEILMERGLKPARGIDEADIIVVNSCVVRQKAENKALAQLSSLKFLKAKRPEMAIAVTGCLVDSNIDELKRRLPHVSLFFPPQGFQAFEEWLGNYSLISEDFPGNQIYPLTSSPAAFLSVIKGCDSFCSYCIVPYRRGPEVSRPVEEIFQEARCLAARGAREIALLGQNVDAYGHDLPEKPDLADLLLKLEEILQLYRLRFLTSHPKYLKEKLIDAIAQSRKVCPYFSLPVQSGDDAILKEMKRGYTVEDYRKLAHRIRSSIEDAAISTDIIVGFPGEREEHFQNTLKLLEEIRFDSIHVAAYSPRSGTLAERTLLDDVPAQEKKRRLQLVEKLNERISAEINSSLLGKQVEVLVEGQNKGKWQGRTKTNKLVFFSARENLLGKLVEVRVERTGPWSLGGTHLIVHGEPVEISAAGLENPAYP